MASFIIGTRRLYDWVNDNDMIEMHPSAYTNDPFIISRNDDMIAINSALEVDLTGQVCADQLGHRFFSGLGGQVDFMRGSARSRGGKPIIALPSTAQNGTMSRISPHLEEGAGVTTPRGDTHYVVTEYGVAELHGKSIMQRALGADQHRPPQVPGRAARPRQGVAPHLPGRVGDRLQGHIPGAI